jgi:hypothetical protein
MLSVMQHSTSDQDCLVQQDQFTAGNNDLAMAPFAQPQRDAR